MRLVRKPLTLLFVLCLASVCVGVIGAIVCSQQKSTTGSEKCTDLFEAPIASLSCVACCAVLFALAALQFSGQDTGMMQ